MLDIEQDLDDNNESENKEFDVKEELGKLPKKPGVYIMHDADDTILYVGKAKNLHSRVRSYFKENIGRGPQIDKMVSLIARFEYIVTDSELEALVLENNLIKEYSPKYNTLLKDDKTYPYIKVTLGEEYPRVMTVRQMKKDKAKYFGPFTNGGVKESIDLINKLYQLRTCNRKLPKDCGKERPCLNYHIGQCCAPCQGGISKEAYAERIDKAVEFLNGKQQPILRELKEKMQQASERMDFEEAIRYRDLIDSVKKVSETQKMSDNVGEDKDIIALAIDGNETVVQVFFLRNGKLIGREHFYMTQVEEPTPDNILTSFVKQFYAGSFPGGSTSVFAAENDGVGLPMETSKFETFSQADYDALFAKMSGGEITIQNGTEDSTTADLTLTKTKVNFVE